MPRVLITSGGTRERIDAVRAITNLSTGATGAALADQFSQAGWEVILLSGPGALRPRLPCERLQFTDFASLDERLKGILASEPFDSIVHAAAVSDYSVAEVGGREPDASAKLDTDPESRGRDELVIRLKRNPKLVNRLRAYAAGSRRLRLVAFKLTYSSDPCERARAVARLAGDGGIDFIVHNDLLDRDATGRHEFSLFQRLPAGELTLAADRLNRDALGRELVSHLGAS